MGHRTTASYRDVTLRSGKRVSRRPQAGISQVELEAIEVEIRVPALNSSEAPDTRTLTCEVYQGAAASPTTVVSSSYVLPGAGGLGIAKNVLRLRVQPNAGRYLRAKFTGGTSFGNASSKSGVLALIF